MPDAPRLDLAGYFDDLVKQSAKDWHLRWLLTAPRLQPNTKRQEPRVKFNITITKELP